MAHKHEAIMGRSEYYRVDPRSITVKDGWNPRKSFGDERDGWLVESIKENGVIEPLRVKMENDVLVLIDGERRLRATLKAIEDGCEIVSIPAHLEKKTMNEIDALTRALVANDSKPLNPSEEAEAYKRLMSWGLTVNDVTKKVGRSIPHVYNRLKLVDASPTVKEAVDTGKVTIGKAKDIVEESGGSIEEMDKKVTEAIEDNGGDKRKSPKKPKGDAENSEDKPKKPKKASYDREELESLMESAITDCRAAMDNGDTEEAAWHRGAVHAYSIVLDVPTPNL